MTDTPRTGDAPGDEGSDHDLTGAGAGTSRGERDHEGNPRSGPSESDGGATGKAAEELDQEYESEPTRSE